MQYHLFGSLMLASYIHKYCYFNSCYLLNKRKVKNAEPKVSRKFMIYIVAFYRILLLMPYVMIES